MAKLDVAAEVKAKIEDWSANSGETRLRLTLNASWPSPLIQFLPPPIWLIVKWFNRIKVTLAIGGSLLILNLLKEAAPNQQQLISCHKCDCDIYQETCWS